MISSDPTSRKVSRILRAAAAAMRRVPGGPARLPGGGKRHGHPRERRDLVGVASGAGLAGGEVARTCGTSPQTMRCEVALASGIRRSDLSWE